VIYGGVVQTWTWKSIQNLWAEVWTTAPYRWSNFFFFFSNVHTVCTTVKKNLNILIIWLTLSVYVCPIVIQLYNAFVIDGGVIQTWSSIHNLWAEVWTTAPYRWSNFVSLFSHVLTVCTTVKKHPNIVIIWLMLSVYVCPIVITLSGFNCTMLLWFMDV